MKSAVYPTIALALVLSLTTAGTQAGEVRVFVAGAAKAAFELVVPDYEKLSGHSVQASYDTVGALRDRITAGDKPDLVILSSAAVDTLAQRALVLADERTNVGVVVAGLAVRRGSSLPDIGTEAALSQTLLAAKTIAQADGARGATSGLHFSKVIAALGLTEQLSARITVLPFGVDVIQGVADGRFELGVSQSSEIVPVPGVSFVGGLPDPYALRTSYVAAVISSSEEGRKLLSFLQTGKVRARFSAAGFERP
jgi:molybdate transport system substrate-binding protein